MRKRSTDTAAPAPEFVARRELLAWYARERRDLPWRRTRDPYAIWLSEAMLQQTRVETVIGYWTSASSRASPTCASLAASADRERPCLTAWSGLGYYRRARNFHCVRRRRRSRLELRRRIPARRRSACAALPGVGPYTTGRGALDRVRPGAEAL
jgi:A/G-specific adenine glycosylase